MKKTKRIVLTISTMAMALCLMVFGVIAAVGQITVITGKITTVITDSSGHARVAIKAYVKGGDDLADYMLYGDKAAQTDGAMFSVPDITLAEGEDMIHKFEFANYGDAVGLISVSIEGVDFPGNFDYIIGDTESFLFDGASLNTNFSVQNFLEEDASETLYVAIRLKSAPALTGNQTVTYAIAITYSL